MSDVYVRTQDLNSWIANHFDKDFISIDDLIDVIEDLDDEVDSLKYKIEQMEQDIEDNYKPISKEEQYEE